MMKSMERFAWLSLSIVLGLSASHWAVDARSLEKELDMVSSRPIYMERVDRLPEYRVIDRECEVYVPVIVNQNVVLETGGRLQDTHLSTSDINILAHLVGAEALNQDMIGKRLVAAVVLNRMESDAFPNTVHDVVYQEVSGVYQFDVVRSGALLSVVIDDSCYEAVYRELVDRIDDQVMFFQRGGYHGCGRGLYKHGDHYFSGLR